MSIRDVEEATLRVAQRWLRDLLFEDWGVKLLALAITLVLWYGVTGQRAPATIHLRGVQLFFLLPADMEIGNEPRDEVDLLLRGSKQALNGINVRDLVATVDVRKNKPGERVVKLSPETITIELPEGVHIERIEPSAVPLRLERRVERELEVAVRFEGTLPEGYELRGFHSSPSKVRVRGPESHVNALPNAPTEIISLDGQTQSFDSPQTAIDIPDRKVIPLDAVVHVRVEIGEENIEQRLTGVPVHPTSSVEGAQPTSTNIMIRGPRSIIEKLRAADLQIILEQRPDGATNPRLSLPPGTEGRVELISKNPLQFSISK